MAEIKDVASEIDITQSGDFSLYAKNVGKHTGIVKTGMKGVETVSNVFEKFPDDPDVASLTTYAGQVAGDAAGFVAECATEAATIALDPIGWLISNGLDFLLTVIQPAQDLLHQVTGDGPSLDNASGNFENIGKGLVDLSKDFVTVADDALADWTGDASDAARLKLAEFAKGIEGVGSSAGDVAQTLKLSSMIMTVIEEVIKAIITELVTWLICLWLPALAAAVVSVGASVAGAASATALKAGSTFHRMTAKLGKLGKILEKILKFFKKVTKNAVKLGRKLGVKSPTIGNNQFKTAATALERKAIQIGTKTKGMSVAEKGATALGESMKAGGKKLLEETVGIGSENIGGNAAQRAKTGGAVIGKIAGYADVANKDDIGGDQSAEDTRKNLKVD